MTALADPLSFTRGPDWSTGHKGLPIDDFTDLPRGETRLGVAGKVPSTTDVAWCLEQGADFVSVGMGAIVHHDFALVAQSVSPTFIDYLDAAPAGTGSSPELVGWVAAPFVPILPGKGHLAQGVNRLE